MGCFYLEKLFLIWDNKTHHMITMSAVDTKNANLTLLVNQVLQLLFYRTCFLSYQSVTGGLRKWLGMNKKHVFFHCHHHCMIVAVGAV
jgi:hypothetical protein